MLAALLPLLQPLSKIIDDVHVSSEEKLKAQAELLKVQTEIYAKVLEHERTLLTTQQAVINAETQGESWLQRSWLPITMLVFLCLIVLDSLGILSSPLAPEAWVVLQIGIGGYTIGRSAEKAVKLFKQ